MDEFFQTLISYLYFVLVGGLLGLLVLMPHLRAQAREKRSWRIGLAVFLGVLAFGVSFIFWSQSEIENELGILQGDAGMQLAKAGELRNELWLRSIVPPELQPGCFSSDPEVCTLAAGAENPFRARGSGLLPNLLRGLIAGGTCAGMVWLLTRSKKKTRG